MPVDPLSGQSAAEIIRLLDLRSHPEGGFFRETFRDPARDARGGEVSLASACPTAALAAGLLAAKSAQPFTYFAKIRASETSAPKITTV